ncbi:hypothetical protein ASPWEDRAFT_30094 [Aspergillus wentii DTO 134E9]|uniref:Uncharacterized protein n=1 Tax=Aspergillus wentii DTO 134E9 TaxID=1073089 RepID=A0A1L9RDI0_ASPWE|nr:uncharacterized protein ASPWEDRAFT_30094 [Aspergillus wentii DTO 134E9]KAI9933243.1 hypothetical protein MW887_007716 [Aspergillus wentii]OJJ32972.1 hypothetical protein ASPWEDRAFT_30094 [Aspergillus wentii DTO 134E9]
MSGSSQTELEAAEILLSLSRAPLDFSNGSNTSSTFNRSEIDTLHRTNNRGYDALAAASTTATRLHEAQPIGGRSEQDPIGIQGHAVAHAQVSPRNAEQRPSATEPENALQAFLFRQQVLAGIAPDQMITMRGNRNTQSQARGRGAENQRATPVVIQITNEGVTVPNIPPARFNGVLRPFPNLPVQPSHNFDPPARPPVMTTSNRMNEGGRATRQTSTNNRVVVPYDAPTRPTTTTTSRVSETRRPTQQGHGQYVFQIEPVSNRNASQSATTMRTGTINFGLNPEMRRIPQAAHASNTGQNRYSLYRNDMSLRYPASSAVTNGRASIQQEIEQNRSRPSVPISRQRPLSGGRTDASQAQKEVPKKTTGLQQPNGGHGENNARYSSHQVVTGTSRISSDHASKDATTVVAGAQNLQSGTEPGNVEGPTENQFDLMNAFLYHPELLLKLTEYLPVRGIINLFSISKGFHHFLKARLSDFINRQALTRAPGSARLFPFRCYRKLCIEIPRTESSAEDGNHLAPSLKWLSMICCREKVVHDVMRNLREIDPALPNRCQTIIKKLWFLMDMPDNERRIFTIRNKNLWPDNDIFFANLFLIRLDMRFANRAIGRGQSGMRRLLMAQPSLQLLWAAIQNTALKTYFETLKAFVHWRYTPLPQENGMWILGVPPDKIGLLQYEGYGKTNSRVIFQRPDELILKEAVRRELDVQQMYANVFSTNNTDIYTGDVSQEASWEDEAKNHARELNLNWLDVMKLD